MRRNIFIREYTNREHTDDTENILTESLLDYLSNSNPKILNNFLHSINKFNFKVKDINQVKFDMQLKESETIPDASIYDGNNFYIHIEVKRFEHSLRESQLEGHLNGLIEKSQKKKYLLVITNDYGEPKEFSAFKEKHKRSNVEVAFLAWSQIYDFVKKDVPNSICDKKDIFLRDQYLEYLEEERMKIAKWSGFNKQDKALWLNFINFYKNQDLLFRDIKKHLEQKLLWEETGDTKKPDDLWFGYKPWESRNKKVIFYIGLRCIKKDKEDEVLFYVQWHLNNRLKQKLRRTDKLERLKEKLFRKGYKEIWHDSDFEKRLWVKELLKIKNPEYQRERVLKFVDSGIKDYERCGIKNTLVRL